MNDKSFWDRFSTWKEAEEAWDRKKERSARSYPIKSLSKLPSMVGIVDGTRRHLRWKGLSWLIRKDKSFLVLRSLLSHPFRYCFRYVRSCFDRKAYTRDEDFFLYGIQSIDQFYSLLQKPDTLFVLGFAYCQKPYECPSGRFSAQCLAASEHPVCSQCFIGKCVHSLPKESTLVLIVPTIHYIGRKVFEIQKLFPNKTFVFLMTACEMVLEMFGDLGNMADIKGIGVRLDGRICNTFRSFELAEHGVKPGLTLLLPETEGRVLDCLARWRSYCHVREREGV